MPGGSQKSTTTLPDKTANDLELERLNLESAQRQILAGRREEAFATPAESFAALNAPRQVNPAYTQQQAALAAFRPETRTLQAQGYHDPRSPGYGQLAFPQTTPPGVTAPQFLPSIHDLDSPAFRTELQRKIDEQTQNRNLQDLIQAQTLSSLTGKPASTFLAAGSPFATQLGTQDATGTQAGQSALAIAPVDQALIDELYTGARTTGEQDIRRFAEGLGGQRGLRLTDSPIGGEALRQQERLTTQLRSAQAGTTLDLGLQNRTFLEQQRQYQTSFQEGLRQFQQGLQQQATQNRLAIAGMQPPGIGLGLNYGFQNRAAQATTTTRMTPSFGETFGQIAGGAGGLALGLGVGFGGGGDGLGLLGAFNATQRGLANPRLFGPGF